MWEITLWREIRPSVLPLNTADAQSSLKKKSSTQKKRKKKLSKESMERHRAVWQSRNCKGKCKYKTLVTLLKIRKDISHPCPHKKLWDQSCAFASTPPQKTQVFPLVSLSSTNLKLLQTLWRQMKELSTIFLIVICWEYNIFPIFTTKFMNCANLVWQYWKTFTAISR